MELKLRMVFEVANEGIIVTNEDRTILAVNPAFSEITGYRPDEVIGERTSMLSAGVHGPEFYRAMWDTLRTHSRWSGEIVNRRKDGVTFSEWLSIAAVDGEFQGSRRYVGLISDISERKKEEEHSAHGTLMP
jgi:PAS domain S-box-containing protein